MASTTTVTSSDLFKHWMCPHWLYFDGYHGKAKPAKPVPFASLLLDGRVLKPENALEKKSFVKAKGKTPAALEKSARLLMKKGTERILGGVLSVGGLVAMPDLLEKQEGKSDLGDWFYEAADIRGVDRPSGGHFLQMELSARVLEAVQGKAPKFGSFINAFDGAVTRQSLADVREDLDTALTEIALSRAGNCPTPYLSSGCKQSPWFSQCIALAEKGSDLALLYSIREKHMARLREVGVNSLHDAAEMDPKNLAQRTGVTMPTLERHRLQADALLKKEHYVRVTPILPEAAMEIFFDIEGDPLRGVEYLLGAYSRETGEKAYIPFLAKTPAGEKMMWQRFMRWVNGLPPSIAVYHFGAYEEFRLGMLERRYGGGPALDRFRGAMVDLGDIVKESLILPLYFYGLKEIGGYIGAIRSKEITNGAASIGVYESWLKKKDLKILESLVEYNRDDVLVTAALKDWLMTLRV